MLKFSFSNSKLMLLADYLHFKKAEVVAFDLPAGWTCPKAGICKTFAKRDTGKMRKVGPVVCYAAKGESAFPAARRLRWHNFDELVACGNDSVKIFEALNEALPKKAKIVRIHSSGDFFRREYFEAWKILALAHPEINFFGYTKILTYALEVMPDNMRIQYSYGSKDDLEYDLISPELRPATCFIGVTENQYPGVKVVCGSKETAHEDYFAVMAGETFVINMH